MADAVDYLFKFPSMGYKVIAVNGASEIVWCGKHFLGAECTKNLSEFQDTGHLSYL